MMIKRFFCLCFLFFGLSMAGPYQLMAQTGNIALIDSSTRWTVKPNYDFKIYLYYSTANKGFYIQVCTNNRTICSPPDFKTGRIYNDMTEPDFAARVKDLFLNYMPAIIRINVDQNENNKAFTDAYDGDTYKNSVSAAYEKFTKTINDYKEKVVVENKKDTIARNSLEFLGAIYANHSGIADDDPSGFTQYYARVNVPLRKAYGIDSSADYGARLIGFRNLLIQLTYANADKLPVYPDTPVNAAAIHYVNRMDLLERAYVKASSKWNLLTFIMPSGPKHSGDLAHLYLDFCTTFVGTKIYDTSAITKSYSVYSSLFALSVGFRSKKLPFSNVPLGLELNFETITLSTQSNAVNSNLNFQYANRQDYKNQWNSDKALTIGNRLFFHYDLLLSYNTSSSSTSINQNASNIFFHFSYYTNLAGRNSPAFSNNYMQFQLGYALDIGKLFPSKSGSSSGGN